MKVRIGSYNIGDFSGDGLVPGTNEARAAQREVIEEPGAIIWALQEDVEFFNKEAQEYAFDAVYSSVLPNYKRNFTGNYNGKAFLTKFELSDVAPVKYVGDFKWRHPWYFCGKVNVEGKEITIICLHLDWYDKIVRAEEIRQLVEFIKTQEYCIVMGDFNPEDYINGERLSKTLFYKEELARFEAVGFEAANAGRFGVFNTLVNSTGPWDNILVSRNINILSVETITEPWMNDHAIVVADIAIG